MAGLGGGGRTPEDVWVLLGIVFATFSLQFFAATAPLVLALRLTPRFWESFFLWQPFTYALMGTGGASLWILLELWILWMFARDALASLGRKRFWTLLVGGSLAAAAAALAAHFLTVLAGISTGPAFAIMQGQRMLLTLVIAAFAVTRARATVMLFFVLPVQAKHFLWLEVLFAFIAFLGTKDFAGFVGICTAVAVTWIWLTRRSTRGLLREARLRIERKLIERKMASMKKKRGFRVVDGGRESGTAGEGKKANTPPWVN